MEEKEFLEKCRFYLTSISARSAQYAYFNVFKDPNIIVLSNSTTSKKDNPEHGDRIMGFRIGELSYHFVWIKDSEFVSELKRILKFDTEITAVHIINFYSELKKTGIKKFLFETNKRGVSFVPIKDDKTKLIALTVDSFHILHVIGSVYNTIDNVVTNPEIYSGVISDVEKDVTYYGRVYYRVINPNNILKPDGTKFYPELMNEIRVFCMDGLTSVSLKEFIKKLKKPYRFIQYLWIKDNCPQIVYEFEDDFALVRSYRPSVTNLLLPATIKTDLYGGELGGNADDD